MNRPEYPRVISRAKVGRTESLNVRTGPEPNQVIHMDSKPGESLTDDEAVAMAAWLSKNEQLISAWEQYFEELEP